MWIYVLKLLQKRPMYGYEIKEEIEKNFGWTPATITSYVVLYKLESGGYVVNDIREEKGNKIKRKYYSITDKGDKLLNDGLDFIKKIVEKIESD
ncbi:MAG: PadR family transcriptional regulator [Candidatus Methanofastidiosia archaeon]